MSKIEKLIIACNDITEIMSLDPKIETDDKSQMRLDLVEAAKLLKSPDMSKLKDETIATLEKLGVELPKKEKKSEKKENEKKSEKKENEKGEKEDKKVSCFGHRQGTQAALMDEMLIKGATYKEMQKQIGCDKGRVDSHLKHLENKKKLFVHRNEKTEVIKVKANKE